MGVRDNTAAGMLAIIKIRDFIKTKPLTTSVNESLVVVIKKILDKLI